MKIKRSNLAKLIQDNNIDQIALLFADVDGNTRIKYVGVNEILDNSHVSWYNGMSVDGTKIPSFENMKRADWLVIIPNDNVGYAVSPRDNRPYGTLDLMCNLKGNRFGPRNIARTVSNMYQREGLRINMGPKLRFYTDISKQINQGEFLSNSYELYPNFRTLVVSQLNNADVDVEYHSAPAINQIDIDLVPKELVKMADNIFFSKEMIQRLANEEGMKISFITSLGSSYSPNLMQTHQSVWDGTKKEMSQWKNLFFEPEDKSELSELGKHYIAGILNNIESIIPITLPNFNAFKAYLNTEETEIRWSTERDQSIINVPMYFNEKKKKDRVGWSKRMLLKPVSSQANPYLAFAMMAAAGLEGIKGKMSYEDKGELFETDYSRVLEVFRDSPLARKILGRDIVEYIYSSRLRQFEEISKDVTQTEVKLFL